jgi:hypothetical protein
MMMMLICEYEIMHVLHDYDDYLCGCLHDPDDDCDDDLCIYLHGPHDDDLCIVLHVPDIFACSG